MLAPAASAQTRHVPSRIGQCVVYLLFLLSRAAEGAPTQPRVIDMSHSFDNTTVYWPGADAFKLTETFKGLADRGYWYESNRISGAEHGGTHVDAPCHFYKGGWTVDQIPVENLIGPAVVINITSRASENADAVLDKTDMEDWEKVHGKIPKGAIVFMNSGWDAHWPNEAAYLGTDAGKASDLHFPGFDPEAVQWLMDEREVVGMGVDTPSVDHGPSVLFQSHVNMFRNNVYGLENVKNLGQLPPKGATVHVMPMKITGGSGAPTRIVAIVDPMKCPSGAAFVRSCIRFFIVHLIVLCLSVF